MLELLSIFNAALPGSFFAAITPLIILVFILGFACEFLDSSVGMGYGTTIVPALLFLGFTPLEVIPAVLVSQTAAGFFAAFFHHREGNADFGRKGAHLKIALVLAACSLVGVFSAVFLAVSIPQKSLSALIGLIVVGTGVFILAKGQSAPRFSWKRIVGIGTLASFNKGASGGGYGPLVVTGQMLSGVAGKNAIAITALAEALTSISAVFAYFALGNGAQSLGLAPVLVTSALLSVPFSAKAVKKIEAKSLTKAIGAFAILLGAITLAKAAFA